MNPSNLNAMTDEIKQVVHIAQRLAKENMHSTYSPAHLLKAILHKDFPLLKKLESLGIDVYYIEEWAEIRIETYPRSSGMSDNPQPDKDAKAVFEEADNIRLKINRDVVDLDSLIISCVTPGVGFNYEQLKTLPITPFILLEKLQSNIPIQTSDSQEKGNASGNTSLDALHKYCYHKTEQAREGKLQNIIGRDKEIRQMSEILSRKFYYGFPLNIL